MDRKVGGGKWVAGFSLLDSKFEGGKRDKPSMMDSERHQGKLMFALIYIKLVT